MFWRLCRRGRGAHCKTHRDIPLLIDLFDELKAHLVTGHQLTNIQRVEKLLGLPAMGQQKPSEQLPEMLQIVPG
jgi:hypothetical protein